MFTSIDKALVAAIMSAVFLWNYFMGGDSAGTTVTEEQVSSYVAIAVAVLNPILVYLVPNLRNRFSHTSP